MCVQMLPMLLSAGGTAIQQYGQNEARREQNRELSRRVREQNERSAQGSRRVSEEIQRVSKSNAEPEREAAQAEFMAALQKASATDGGDGFDTVGAVSDRFATDADAARTAAGNESAVTAANLARIDAPFRQRTRENTGFNRTATDLSLISGQAGSENFLSQLRQSLIAPRGQEIGGLIAGLGNSMSQRTGPLRTRVGPAGSVSGAPNVFGGVYNPTRGLA